MKTMFYYLTKSILWILLIIAITVFIWAIIFKVYLVGLYALLGGLIIVPFKIFKIKNAHFRISVIVLFGAILLATFYNSVREFNTRITDLHKKQTNNDAFSFRDKLGIYGLNMMMGTSAYCIYPEVSKETLHLMVPAPENGVRTFHSDFAMKSEKIAEVGLKVKVEYPEQSYITLLSDPGLKIEEGLFWVLQQEGWLHPYTAEWKFKLNIN